MLTNTINIIDEIKASEYHSSIILSYSFDLQFFEKIIYPTFKSNGCRNNILLVDSDQFQRAIDWNYDSKSMLGRNYIVYPVKLKGSFHPKILFLCGFREIKVLVGTGNLSLGGYSKNYEIFYKIVFDEEQKDTERIVRDIWNFIKVILADQTENYLIKKLKEIEQEHRFLTQQKSNAPSKKELPELLIHSKEKSILEQLYLRLPNKKCEELIVVSPFFDEKSRVINDLITKIKPNRCNVIFQKETVSLNKSTFPKGKNIKCYAFPYDKHNTYLHAKIYIASYSGESHLFIGSANCTNSGLGYHKSISPNIEAMVYAKSLDKDRWKTELELDKIIKSKNEINISDELIRFDKPTKTSHNYDFHISYVEYRNNHFIVQLGKNVAGSDYSLHLLDDSKEELLVIKKCQLKNNSLVFELNTKVKEFPSLCFLHINKVGDSNIQVINNIGELSYNAPKPSLTYLYEIIEAQNSDKFADFGNLLDPIEKLIENDYNNYRIITLHNSSDDNDFQENKSSVDITYEEFIGKEKPIHISSKNKIYAESTDLGFLLKYLLSRIGLYKKTESVDADEELSISEGIYDEEKNEDDLRWKSDEYYYYSTKKHIKYSNQTEVRYYKNGIKRLASRFTNYLEFLHEGDGNKNLAPPSSIDSSFIYKYLSVLMLVNYFAGREYKVGKEVVETLSIVDDNYMYWIPTLDIIGLTFCYQDSKGDIETIFRRTNINLVDLASNDDLKAIILLTLFTLSSLKVLYAEEETRDIDVTFIRFAMAVELKNFAIDQSELHEHFDKYYKDCGYSNKRHVLTQKKIISIEKIYKAYNKLNQLYRGMDKRVKQYEKGDLNFDELRKEKKSTNNFVWNPRTGLSFIEEFTSEKIVMLYNFGHNESKRFAVDFLAPFRPR